MKRLIEHGIAAWIAGVTAFVIWFFLLAQPLEILGFQLDEKTAARGEEVGITARGSKPWWSVKFCEAISDYTYISDSTGVIASKSNPVNFNDGSIKRVPNSITIPDGFSRGRAVAWKRVTYKCFLRLQKTVTSPSDFVVVM